MTVMCLDFKDDDTHTHTQTKNIRNLKGHRKIWFEQSDDGAAILSPSPLQMLSWCSCNQLTDSRASDCRGGGRWMRARDGREDERKYERRRRRRRIESVRWRWMTDRTMRRGFTEEAGNPKKKKRKKIKMKGRRRREEGGGGTSPVLRHNLPHYTTSKDTVSSVNCTLSSLTSYLHQSSVQKNRKKKDIYCRPVCLIS